MGKDRIKESFAAIKRQGRTGLIVFLTAGFPDKQATLELVPALVAAGADAIELGVPFSDPLAEGPVIQQSSFLALQQEITLADCMDMVEELREQVPDTPLVLMGYYNPIYIYGVDDFLRDAKAAGVDGLIVVDLPPEEDSELCLPSLAAGMHFVRLATPTTDDQRLPAVLDHSSGFLYYVAIAGITGTASATRDAIHAAVRRLKNHTDLPIAVGFGIKTPEQAAAVAQVADAAVVGSAIVQLIADNLDDNGQPAENLVDTVLDFVRLLADGVRSARPQAAD